MNNKIKLYLGLSISIALVLSTVFFVYGLYVKKVNIALEVKKATLLDEYISMKKKQGESSIESMNLLFDDKNKNILSQTKQELKATIKIAYDKIKIMYDEKSSKKNILSEIQKINKQEISSVYVTDFTGENLISRDTKLNQKNISAFESADGRAIVLEEIQKARKHKEGFIVTNFYEGRGENIIAVKDMDMHNWYMGSFINLKTKENSLKLKLLAILNDKAFEENDFMILFEGDEAIFVSKNIKEIFDKDTILSIAKNLSKKSTWTEDESMKRYYRSKYYAPFNWYVVYGFDISKKLINLDMSLRKQLLF